MISDAVCRFSGSCITEIACRLIDRFKLLTICKPRKTQPEFGCRSCLYVCELGPNVNKAGLGCVRPVARARWGRVGATHLSACKSLCKRLGLSSMIRFGQLTKAFGAHRIFNIKSYPGCAVLF